MFLEDLNVVEGMQRGRHSPAFDGGRFSEVMDTASHHFARWLARNLGAPATERGALTVAAGLPLKSA